MESKKTSAELDEKRALLRASVRTPVRITFDGAALEGTTENLSAAGIMCLADSILNVQVEVDRGQGRELLSGRLVRASRMGEHGMGFAIEFDAQSRG